MPRYLAVLEYDGTDFCGSQRQARERSVQGDVERALQALTDKDEKVRIAFASRTDKGVHARGQVIGFDLRRMMPEAKVTQALNGLLPRDVSVREAVEIVAEFNPRRWAVSRRYSYYILNRAHRSALLDRYVWHLPHLLDLEAMREAGESLVGCHDFGAFGRPPQGDNTWRTVSRLAIDSEDCKVRIVLEADAFLRRMVRLIVGALVDVGRRKMRADSVQLLLDGKSKQPQSAAAPAKGLVLEGVAYERQRLGKGTGLWWSCDPLTTTCS